MPTGATNYVTPNGFLQLAEEREMIEKKLANLDIENEKEKRHVRATLTGSLNLLNVRIASARILKPEEQPHKEVRFGALVQFEFLAGPQRGKQQSFQLVGVDEANIKENKIAFVAPLSIALSGKKEGETAKVQLGGNIQELKIISIKYL